MPGGVGGGAELGEREGGSAAGPVRLLLCKTPDGIVSQATDSVTPNPHETDKHPTSQSFFSPSPHYSPPPTLAAFPAAVFEYAILAG